MRDTMILFDLDGTLWDSSGEVALTWNDILQKELPGTALLTADDIKSVMGKTMNEIADALFPDLGEEDRSVVFEDCMRHENEYLSENGAVLMKGVRETLHELKDRGFLMAVVSNCQSGYIPAFIRSMNMSEFFCDYEEWGRTGLPKSENIRLVLQRNGFEKGIYVGDTQKDGDSARAAGVPFIHAAYGFGTDSAPDGVINEMSELPGIVTDLIKGNLSK